MERVERAVAVRAPHLYTSLRGFVLGAFAYLLRELDEGAELPVAFVEHEHAGGPALYEYRPLVRAFVEERAPRLRGRDDALIALEELEREPAAAIFARAHAGPRPSEDEALFRTVLLGLLVSTAEACGGFDWDDESFDRAYAELERSLFGERRTYAAVAPLVGISVTTQLELAPGLRVRAVADGELARHWPEAGSLVPKDFGRETDRYCVLELRAALAGARIRPTRRRRSPMRSVRSGSRRRRLSRPARCCSRRSTAARSGSGRSSRSRPRNRPATRRGWTRSAERSPESCSCGSPSPTPTARWRRRSTAGSSRSSRTSRSAPISSAPRSSRCSARRGRCGRLSCSRPSRVRGRRCTQS